MSEFNTNTAADQLSVGMIITVVQDVLKRWYLIVAAAAIAAMAAFIIADYTYKPVYTAATTFVVTADSTTNTTYNNLNTANTIASVFTEVLNSSLLRQKVLEESGLPAFSGTITANVIPDTNLLTMTVKGRDPRAVFLMSKAIIEHHHTVSAEVLGGVILEVLQEPIVPVRPSNPPVTKTRMAQAALLAAVAVAVLLVAEAVMSDKIRSRSEADTKLSCHVLGELYHERKNKTFRAWLHKQKKSILITDPLTSFLYTEAVHKLSGRVDKRRHRGERILMVTSFLENEGKSTVSVNLALSMAKKGKKVLLVDCDLRKPSCSLILGFKEPMAGITEVLQGKAALADCIVRLEDSGLDLLAARKSFKTAANLVSTSVMEAMLKDAARHYDLVIVDTPPMSVAPDTEAIADFADASLLVVRQNGATADALNAAAAILAKASHLLGCVLNNVYGSDSFAPVFHYNSYGAYGKYGKYGKYSKYGSYGKYGYGKERSKENDA